MDGARAGRKRKVKSTNTKKKTKPSITGSTMDILWRKKEEEEEESRDTQNIMVPLARALMRMVSCVVFRIVSAASGCSWWELLAMADSYFRSGRLLLDCGMRGMVLTAPALSMITLLSLSSSPR